jgi:hypothetical protein
VASIGMFFALATGFCEPGGWLLHRLSHRAMPDTVRAACVAVTLPIPCPAS